MSQRTGTCEDCSTIFVAPGMRGRIAVCCPPCTKTRRRAFEKSWSASRPPRQRVVHTVTCTECSAVFPWSGRGLSPGRCTDCTKARRLMANKERGRLRRAAKKAGTPGRIGVCIECFVEFQGPLRGSISQRCPVCTEEWNKVRHKHTVGRPEGVRRRHLLAKYGMSPADWDRLFEVQSGRCAICQLHEDEAGGRLHVDHCHATGSVRGLLCRGCNTGIGKLREDPEIIRAAAAYVEHHKAATP